MKFTNQMAMDCVQSALAAAMDAKKSGIKYTDKQKASVKCHAKDPANCRFHKTGKFAGLKDTEAFSTNLGECSKDDIQDYINEALEAKGLKGQVSLSTYGDSGDKFLAEYTFPDGTTEEEKLAAKSELENIMFDNGEMLDIKDELASKSQQDTDYTKYAAFKVDGFVNAEESDTVSHPFEQEDIVKPDGEGGEGGEPPKGAIEGEGAEFAKTASAEHQKLVSDAKDILAKCGGMESAGYGEKAILDAAAALKSNLEDLDFFSAKLQKATDTKTKAKCQTYLEETLLDVQNGQEELAALVEKAQSKAKDEAKAKSELCDKELSGFFTSNGCSDSGSVSEMLDGFMGDGFGGTSFDGFPGGAISDAMKEFGFNEATVAAKQGQHAYEDAKFDVLAATQSGDVLEMKNAAEGVEKAKDAYLSALNALNESAKKVKTKLMEETEALKAGMSYEAYQKKKQAFLSIGAKSGYDDLHEYKIGDDGFMTVVKKPKPPKEETSGAGKGASASAGKAPKPAKPTANASATGYSHATASKEQKGAAVVAKLEKMIAGCKDPAMKAKYEKALAAQKKLFGIGEKAQGGSATGDSKGLSLHFGNKVSAQETLEKSLDKLSITGEPNTASIDHLYADGGGWKVVMDPESGLGDVKAFAESITENHPDCAVKFDEDMNDGSHFEIQILPKKGI